MKFLAMHITNQKLSFDIFMVGNLLNIFTEHDLNILMIFGIKEKSIILTHTMYCCLLLQIYLCYLWLLLCCRDTYVHNISLKTIFIKYCSMMYKLNGFEHITSFWSDLTVISNEELQTESITALYIITAFLTDQICKLFLTGWTFSLSFQDYYKVQPISLTYERFLF